MFGRKPFEKKHDLESERSAWKAFGCDEETHLLRIPIVFNILSRFFCVRVCFVTHAQCPPIAKLHHKYVPWRKQYLLHNLLLITVLVPKSRFENGFVWTTISSWSCRYNYFIVLTRFPAVEGYSVGLVQACVANTLLEERFKSNNWLVLLECLTKVLFFASDPIWRPRSPYQSGPCLSLLCFQAS